jgi:hypothetical protein
MAIHPLATSLLAFIVLGRAFLPWTRAAMRPSTVVHILNDIFINDRRSIIEFGAGISTLYLAWAAKQKQMRYLSIEENQGWAETIRAMLQDNGLKDYCELHWVPREDEAEAGRSNRWYNKTEVRRLIGKREFDLVVVDGPAAYQTGQEQARRPALDFLLPDHLFGRCAIFLDDAGREGERQIVSAWEATLGGRAMIDPVAGGHAYLSRGEHYFSGI